MIHCQPTEYSLSLLPEDHRERYHFTIVVSYRGKGLWSVMLGGSALSTVGMWDYEPLPSSRTDDWLAHHRFSLGDALWRAEQMLPAIRVNRFQVRDGEVVKVSSEWTVNNEPITGDDADNIVTWEQREVEGTSTDG